MAKALLYTVSFGVVVALALFLYPQAAETPSHPSILTPEVPLNVRTEEAFVRVQYLSDPPRMRALLIGDSNIFGPLGKFLERSLGALGYDVERRGKPTSGLARPDFFNWPEQAQVLLDAHDPHLVIAMFGGNDGQRMEFQSASGEAIKMPAGEAWEWAYQERIREFALLLRGTSRRVFILSPTNRRPRFAREKMIRVRQAQQRALEGLGRVTWVDMFPFSSDPSGQWLGDGSDIDGNPVRYRREDGIHLTPAGGQRVGELLLEHLMEEGITLCEGLEVSSGVAR